MGEGLSNEVKEFIRRYITSVEQLEILLVLKAEPDGIWTSDELSRRLYTTSESIENRIAELRKHGLVEEDESGRFRLGPVSSQTTSTIEAVAESYARRRVTVINLIFSGPSQDVQGFADAFRFRKDDE